MDESRNIIAIDTATEACSVALAVGDRVVHRHVVAGRDQTAVLVPLFNEVLAEGGINVSQLDAIACGVGPGSFAGVRIGVGFVKGLTFVRDIPIVPILSLACLAQGAMRRSGKDHVVSCIDARMGEVYAGVFARGDDGSPRVIEPPQVCKPDALNISVSLPWIASGTGWGTYRDTLLARLQTRPAAEEPTALPEAIDAIAIARAALKRGETIAAEALEPVYLRNDVALTLEQQAKARQQKSNLGKAS